MSDDDARRAVVGQQLADRRVALDLTQEKLAERIGVSGRTVSAIERGMNTIQLNRRSSWEEALKLTPGTITRAYTTGTPIEALAEETEGNGLIAVLTARVERLEENLDVERRARRALARKVAELWGSPAGDPADEE